MFIHESIRDEIISLLLAYYITGARLKVYLQNNKAEVKRSDGKIDKLVFEGLI
jgi:hypothetical protein